MQFIGRKNELLALETARKGSLKGPARMTVVLGRRRIGKTTLILESVKGTPYVYWFITQGTEKDLVTTLLAASQAALGDVLPQGITSFASLFDWMMRISEAHPFTLVIDEFQNLAAVNPTLFSRLQDLWDRLRNRSHLNLILCGSAYSMMKRIFEDRREPLFGRATTKIQVKAFTPAELVDIAQRENPAMTNDDLLALFSITGGVPYYVEDFVDNNTLKKKAMFQWVVRPRSFFLAEGLDLLRLEIGSGQSTYLSILRALASGQTQAARIADLIGIPVITSYLERLELYGFVEKMRPVLAKPNTRAVRWKIKDPFLRFWFRFIESNANLISCGETEAIAQNIEKNYETFSGLALEQFFQEKLRTSGNYRLIGNWWSQKLGQQSEQNEVDIVAISCDEKSALVAEVKRQKKSFREKAFRDKVEYLKTTALAGFQVKRALFTLEDIGLKN